MSEASPAMKCPICLKSAVPEFKPFCSKRCADLDLGKWMSDSYAIPGEPADQAEDTPYDKKNEE